MRLLNFHRSSQLVSLSRTVLSLTSDVSITEGQISRHFSTWIICQKLHSAHNSKFKQNSWQNTTTSLPRQPIHTAVPSSLLSSRRGSMSDLDDVRQFVGSLTSTQRNTLEKAMEELKAREDVSTEVPPTWNQLKLLCYQHSLPFIGFGFLDNVIMITVGEYIDSTLGIVLGISTMAAAGLGNMISDLAGLGLADRVEALCQRLGIPNPNLSSSQLQQRASRLAALFGRCIGIIIGCTIGMAPLLLFNDPHKKHVDNE